MIDQQISALIGRWMSDKEARVYVATLELGFSPASTIARRAWIKRVTTYAILKDLERRGVAQSIEKTSSTYFQVIDPVKLGEVLKNRFEQFSQSIPELLALANVYNNKPKIQYYDGFWWISELYEDMLTSTVDICAFVWLETMDPALSDHLFKTHVVQRAKKWIMAKVITSQAPINKNYQENDAKELRETVIIDDPIFQLANEIDMYGPNKVALCMYGWDEMSGVIIHSKKLYDSLMSIFGLLFKTYKK